MRRKVKIVAEVTAWIECEEGEDVSKRIVDIYLHGVHGHTDKEDLGADAFKIEVLTTASSK